MATETYIIHTSIRADIRPLICLSRYTWRQEQRDNRAAKMVLPSKLPSKYFVSQFLKDNSKTLLQLHLIFMVGWLSYNDSVPIKSCDLRRQHHPEDVVSVVCSWWKYSQWFLSLTGSVTDSTCKTTENLSTVAKLVLKVQGIGMS